MKRRSSFIASVLCLSLVSGFAMGCGSSDSESEKAMSETTESNEVAPAENSAVAESENNASLEASIDEQVIYEANDIKITAKSLEDSWFGPEIKLLIENGSDQDITVQARNANVNGYMIETMMSVDVAAGKNANDSLTFSTSELEAAGIDKIANMEFSLAIFDSNSWTDIENTDVISIDTSIAPAYTQKVDDSGDVLVDQGGIKIVSKGLSDNESIWGPGVILYIENNTDQNITIQTRDVSVNDFMVSSIMSEDVVAGKKSISAVQFLSSDLEENSITDIGDVELYFTIFNADTWDNILDTDIIEITFD